VASVRIDPDVADRLRQKGSASVFVQLRLPSTFRPEGYLDDGQLKAQRAAIAAAQRSVVKALGDEELAELVRFRFIPYLALRIDAKQLHTLTTLPEVSRVVASRDGEAQLDQTIPRIGADRVHRGLSSPGQERSGQRWAVAVLDDGVDAQHPFLGGRVVAEACFSTSEEDAFSICPSGGSPMLGSGSARPCVLQGQNCTHGTATAGIIAGDGQSVPNAPPGGVAPAAAIIAVQIHRRGRCLNDPTKDCTAWNTRDALLALEHVLDLRQRHRIAAVNFSGASVGYDHVCDVDEPHWADMIYTLRSVGIAFVASAGNAGSVAKNIIGAPACISRGERSLDDRRSHAWGDRLTRFEIPRRSCRFSRRAIRFAPRKPASRSNRSAFLAISPAARPRRPPMSAAPGPFSRPCGLRPRSKRSLSSSTARAS
jgi:hypothetical protein